MEKTSNFLSIEMFQFFTRKNHPDVKISHADLVNIYLGFGEYLEDLHLDNNTKSKIFPQSEAEIILDMENPLKINGFHPALLLHFNEFIQQTLD